MMVSAIDTGLRLRWLQHACPGPTSKAGSGLLKGYGYKAGIHCNERVYCPYNFSAGTQ
jgi:hypothetical protein